MEELTKLATIIGEDNEKRLKDSITDLLIKRVEEDLENFQDWIVDLDYLYDQVNSEVYKIVKDKMVEKYLEKMNARIDEMFLEERK
jgi:hypothetical protein